MKREFIINTLLKIKEIDEKILSVYRLGVDLLEFETGISQLEKSIPTIIREEKDEEYGYIEDLVGWWLYEDVEKTIWVNKTEEVHLDNVEDFVDYLLKEYSVNKLETN